MTDPALPVEHGVEITLTCSAGYNNTGGDKATCQSGQLVPTTTPPQCSIRMFLLYTFRSLSPLIQGKNRGRDINII